jgi:K+-transporting ATPase ATPase C chain
MNAFLASIRTAIVTMVVCVMAYTAAVWGIARAVAPASADGSLIRNASGTVIGSSRIAQAFRSPRYFWPRPSAVDYNAAGAGGSNLSPTSTKLTERAEKIVAAYQATKENPLPADLVSASGAGLDPDISLAGALYQVDRIAVARSVPTADVKALVERTAVTPGGPLGDGRIVNVLELNLALDRM